MGETVMKKNGVIGFILGTIVAGTMVAIIKDKKLKEQKYDTLKFLTLFRIMNQYLVTKQLNKKLEKYFDERDIKTIAIYGMSHIGQRIIDDLKNTDIEVIYGIDKRADRMTYELDIYHPEDDLPEVDAIVVTAYAYDEIAEMLAEKVDCEILAFDDIIFSL